MKGRLRKLGVLVLAAACSVAWAQATGPVPDSLRTLAQSRGIRIGAAVDSVALREDDAYAAVLSREFGMLTPENAMKFEVVHPERGRYDFTEADALVAFAEAHAMEVHGHVLLWHEQLPAWLARGNFSREELKAILREHIHAVVGRYRGRIALWDVASEAIADDGSMQGTFWSRGIGPDYLDLAFRWAREADPGPRLLYNDYGGEGLGPKADGIFGLVGDLRKRGVPIDGVGLQMHVSPEEAPSAREVTANMERLAKLGLEVHITEMDVMLREPVTKAKLAAQAKVYRGMLRACLSLSACRSFTLWGLTDRYSWVPEHFPGKGAALIFDREYRIKPAYQALQQALKRRY